ncbi:MAG: type II toxin-antitoxin system VapC family toxin [Armatimonadota bacterium]
MKLISVDTSIIVAILSGEEHSKTFEEILSKSKPIISSVAVLEAFLVVRSDLGDRASFAIEQLLMEYGINQVEFGQGHLTHARAAFERFGKGNHPAKLNFGDCIVYATSKFTSTPLLFLGDDFSQTDIEAVKWA